MRFAYGLLALGVLLTAAGGALIEPAIGLVIVGVACAIVALMLIDVSKQDAK